MVVEPAELDAARTAQGDTGYIETSRDPANYVDSFAPGDEEGCALLRAVAALHAQQWSVLIALWLAGSPQAVQTPIWLQSTRASAHLYGPW